MESGENVRVDAVAIGVDLDGVGEPVLGGHVRVESDLRCRIYR